MSNFNNSTFTVVNEATPDPWLIQRNGRYFLTFTCGDRLEIWSAANLDGLRNPQKSVVWRPPPDQPYSDGVWAPELHDLNGRWYIYFAANHPARGNPSHRMWVLGGGPSNQDPLDPSQWQFLGGIKGMPDRWSIDGTIVTLNGAYYIVWSQWPFGDDSDKMQELFIMRLSDPITGASDPIMISRPTHKWEFSDGDHGVNEGPQWLESPQGHWKGIVYSCAGSWTKDYKLALLTYTGGDPLNPGSWRKERHPLVMNAGENKNAPFGPGHGSFIDFGNGETLALFHATDKETDGWENRKARIQRLVWTQDGPYMGEIVGPHTGDFGVFMQQGPVQGGMGQGQGQPEEKKHGIKGFFHKLKQEL